MTDSRLKPCKREQLQVYAHAALAALVAGWDAFLNEIVREFYRETAKPADSSFTRMHEVARVQAEIRLDRFNTPNWENGRDLLILATGHDPIADWVLSRRGMGVQQVRERLNEILKVRHSFAHGFATPFGVVVTW
jgi:hypothetical protein